MKKGPEIIEIDIVRLLKAIWRRIWIVILAGALCATAAFSYAYFLITPIYSASALMYVNNTPVSFGNASFSISSSDLSVAKSLVDTYIVILKTRTTLEAVIEQADLDYSYEQLRAMVSAEDVDSTEIFKITVTSGSPVEAKKIANTIADILPDRIADIMSGCSVKVVDYAVTPKGKTAPSLTKYTGAGLMIGLLLSCLTVAVADLKNDLVRDADMLPGDGRIPVLAEIPNFYSNGKGYKYRAYARQTDAYREK